MFRQLTTLFGPSSYWNKPGWMLLNTGGEEDPPPLEFADEVEASTLGLLPALHLTASALGEKADGKRRPLSQTEQVTSLASITSPQWRQSKITDWVDTK